MTKFIGKRLAIGIGKESSRGVGVASTYWLNALSFSHKDSVRKARTKGTYGLIAGEGDRALVSSKFAEGSMDAELGNNSFGLILLALLGTVSSAVKETTAYNHTFTLAEDNQHQSLSLHTTDPIGAMLFELTMIDSLSIEIVPDELVKYSVTFKSKNSNTSGAVKSYTSENKFIGRHLQFKIAANTGALGAASKIPLKSLKINFKANADFDNVLGTVQPADILNKIFSITGELTLNYEDRAYMNYMLDGDYKAVRIDLINGDVTIGASSNPELKIDLSKVDFEMWEMEYPLDSISTQKVQFNALFDLSGNNNLLNSVILTNTISSY